MNCEKCEAKLSNALFGQAFTNFNCGLCGATRQSATTHVPGHCCQFCSMSDGVCEECGDALWSDGSEKEDFGKNLRTFRKALRRLKNDDIAYWVRFPEDGSVEHSLFPPKRGGKAWLEKRFGDVSEPTGKLMKAVFEAYASGKLPDRFGALDRLHDDIRVGGTGRGPAFDELVRKGFLSEDDYAKVRK